MLEKKLFFALAFLLSIAFTTTACNDAESSTQAEDSVSTKEENPDTAYICTVELKGDTAIFTTTNSTDETIKKTTIKNDSLYTIQMETFYEAYMAEISCSTSKAQAESFNYLGVKCEGNTVIIEKASKLRTSITIEEYYEKEKAICEE